ncbi:MAG: hypothetical protein M3416_11335 [Acidobacteriota bacterium]|nr:hypothetical protein [Acidobacteriota bacterium]
MAIEDDGRAVFQSKIKNRKSKIPLTRNFYSLFWMEFQGFWRPANFLAARATGGRGAASFVRTVALTRAGVSSKSPAGYFIRHQLAIFTRTGVLPFKARHWC